MNNRILGSSEEATKLVPARISSSTLKGNISTMAIAARNAKQKKIAVTRGRTTQKTTRAPAKGRGAAPVPKRSVAKQATRKLGTPRKMAASAQAAGATPDAVLSAQLEAISHGLSTLTTLHAEIRDLRVGIEGLTDRIDSLAESVHAGIREHPDQGGPLQEPDNPAETGHPEDDTSDVEK